MRFLVLNSLLFIGYLAVGLLSTWLYVAHGQPQTGLIPVINMLGAAFVASVWPVACAANWYLLRVGNSVPRALTGIAIGTAACAIAFVPYFGIIIEFHLWLGGTL
jgi:hypothetical protein